MGAIGYTSGDPNKVDVAGDTMTGDLFLAGATTDLDVDGNTNVDGALTARFQGFAGNVMQLMATTVSTGVASGGVISINANPALADITAATGWVLNYNSQAAPGGANPQLTMVTYPGATGVAPLVGPVVTFWLVDSTGALVQQSTRPTRTQARTHLILGATAIMGGVIFDVMRTAMPMGQVGNQLVDLITSLGAFVSESAGIVTPNGVNKMINVTGGPIFAFDSGLPGTYQSPHISNLTAQTPANFHYATATTNLAPLVNLVDVANFDPGGAGAVVAVGGGANTSTLHRVFGTSRPNVNDQIAIQYGQVAYSSLAAAAAARGSEAFITNPNLAGIPFLGWIAATRTAVDLSSNTQALFFRAPRFSFP